MAKKIDFEALSYLEVQSFINDLLDIIRAFDEDILETWLRANYPGISGIDED